MVDKDRVICCFCGKSLDIDSSVQIVVFPTKMRDESQVLYCHSFCLCKRLYSDIPIHPALTKDENKYKK